MDVLTLLIVVLFIAWLLGGFIFPVVAAGNLIHILLVVCVVLLLVRLMQGRSL